MWKDVYKRPFITAGFTALAADGAAGAHFHRAGPSGNSAASAGSVLHRLIYFSAFAGVIHYYWLVKSDIRRPLLYGAILAVLMLYRTVVWLRSAAR